MDEYELENGTAGQRKRAEELVRLAYAEFEGSLPDGRALLPGEVNMLRGAAMREVVDLASEPGDDRRLWFAPYRRDRMVGPWERWGEHRTIRAAVLRWVCSTNETIGLVGTYGVQISSAHIVGALNLNGIKVDFVLGLYFCVVSSGIQAQQARLASFGLHGSFIYKLHADGIKVTGSIIYNQGFRALGEVRLLSAEIGGNLDCRGGWFQRADGKALSADRIRVTGNVVFNRGFRALGEVRLLGAAIGGNLHCQGGRFERANGDALVADGIKVAGSVFFNGEFRASGEVRLLGATIGGNLSCRGGRFKRSDGDALSADGIKVTGDVFFDEGFRALGEVRLLGASIGGNLECSGGRFERGDGVAMHLEDVEVVGTFLFTPNKIDGQIDLTHARVGYLADFLWMWPEKVRLTDFVYGAIYPAAIGSVEERLEWIAKSDRASNVTGAADYLPDPQPYRQLAKVLRAQGHEEDARRVMRACARRRAIARYDNAVAQVGNPLAKGMSLRVWWQTMLSIAGMQSRGALSLGYGAIAGHGYNRWRPFLWMVGLIVFGALVFSQFSVVSWGAPSVPNPPGMRQTQGVAVKSALSEESAGQDWLRGYPVFRPLAYSADTFLPLVNLHQESYWTPKDGFVKRFYLPFHILMGWVVTTLAAVSVTGLVRHEKE